MNKLDLFQFMNGVNMELSKTSIQKLNTCHIDLQKLIYAVAKEEKCAVICGFRGRYEQEKAYMQGKSKARFGQSKHNFKPSLAVDVVPLPLDWNDIPAFEHLGEKIMAKAEEMGIKVKWGKNFKGLVDYPHFELIEE